MLENWFRVLSSALRSALRFLDSYLDLCLASVLCCGLVRVAVVLLLPVIFCRVFFSILFFFSISTVFFQHYFARSINIFFSSLISLIADGPYHYHPACGYKGSSHLSLVHALQILSRCKFSTLTTRQPMVEFYLLTFLRFPLRKKEHKSYFGGKNRTHDFRTSRCAGYLL